MVDDPSGRYLIMEWIEGEDLAARPAPRTGNRGCRRRTSRATRSRRPRRSRYVHEQQTIHRDVKPQNLMLAPDRGVVLVDFGIARDLAAESATRASARPATWRPRRSWAARCRRAPTSTGSR